MSGADLADFSKLPFYLINPPNSLGSRIAACFEEAGFIPCTYMRVETLRMSSIIASTGLAATFNTTVPLDTEVKTMAPDVNIFPLKSHGELVHHNVYLIHYKNRYMPQYLQYFRNLIIDFYGRMITINLARIMKS